MADTKESFQEKEKSGGVYAGSAVPSLTGGKQPMDLPQPISGSSQRRNSMSGYYQHVTQKGKLILPTALWFLLVVAGICFLSLLASLNKTMNTLDTLVELEQEQARVQNSMYHQNHKYGGSGGHRDSDRRHHRHHHHHKDEQQADESFRLGRPDKLESIKMSPVADPDLMMAEGSMFNLLNPFAGPWFSSAKEPSNPTLGDELKVATGSKQKHQRPKQQPVGASIMMIDTSDDSSGLNPVNMIEKIMNQMTGSSAGKEEQKQPSPSGSLITANIDKINININAAPEKDLGSRESESKDNNGLSKEEKEVIESVVDKLFGNNKVDEKKKVGHPMDFDSVRLLPPPQPEEYPSIEQMGELIPISPRPHQHNHRFRLHHHHHPQQDRPQPFSPPANFPLGPEPAPMMELDSLGSSPMAPNMGPLSNLLFESMDPLDQMFKKPSGQEDRIKFMLSDVNPEHYRRPSKVTDNDWGRPSEIIFGKPVEAENKKPAEDQVSGDLKMLTSVLNDLVKQSESPTTIVPVNSAEDKKDAEEEPKINSIGEPKEDEPKENQAKEFFELFFGPPPASKLVVAPTPTTNTPTPLAVEDKLSLATSGNFNNLLSELKKIESEFALGNTQIPTTETPATTTQIPTTTAPLFSSEKLDESAEQKIFSPTDLMLDPLGQLFTAPQMNGQSQTQRVDNSNKGKL